jgi:hypothetical protein
MRRNPAHPSRVVYHMLLRGFESIPAEAFHDPLKSYRPLRLKQMVLGSIFQDYDDNAFRHMGPGIRYV